MDVPPGRAPDPRGAPQPTLTPDPGPAPADAPARRGFGRPGWSMIAFSGVMYYLYAAWTADGQNVFVTSFATEKGWDAAQLLSLATPSNWVGVLGAVLFGRLVVRHGSRLVAAGALVGGGGCVLWLGHVGSVWEYATALALVCFFATGFGFVVPGTLMNVWFPRTKGLALGWATMGMPVCTATFVILMTLALDHLGFTAAYTAVAVVMLALGVITLPWVKDSPELVGRHPDNDEGTPEELAASAARLRAHRSPFTTAVLLRDRDMWLIACGYGCLWLVTIGIVSQYVLRLVSLGYTESTATTMLAVAAVCALPGSYLWGWLDVRLGTKRASIIYTATYVVILVCLVVPGGTVFTFVTSVLVGSGLAGIKELITSMTGTVFGRYDFTAANAVITPIANLIRASTFVVMGTVLSLTGSYTGAYLIFIVIDLVGLVLIWRITDGCKGTVVGGAH